MSTTLQPLVARRLFLQQAPSAVVLDACQAITDWPSLAAQERILQALKLATAPVASAYRLKVLKGLVRLLDREEMHEDLLGAHLAALHARPPADACGGGAEEWTHLAFEPVAGATLSIRVGNTIGGGAETGCMLWPAATFLSAWLVSQPRSEFAGAHVLELGSGTGLAGLVFAESFPCARVTLTDYLAPTLDNLRWNVSQQPPSTAERVRVRSLDWHDALGDELDAEIVLAADVVYEPSLFAPLVTTLRTLLTRPPRAGRARRALLAAERRSERWSEFEQLLAQHALAWRDRSDEARALAAAPGCPFYSARDGLPRMSLLEIHAPPAQYTCK
jgi:hypothetical protein